MELGELSGAFSGLLVDHDLEQLRLAVKSELNDPSKVSFSAGEEIRSSKIKVNKETPNVLKIKGTDKGSWSGTATKPLLFWHANATFLDLEKAGIFIKLDEIPLAFAGWLDKFELTPEIRDERTKRAELLAKANAASKAARDAILAGV